MLFILMASLGMGNGSVFQMIPQRFRLEIGVMTGLVGAAGGVGGYYLNLAMGNLHDVTGTYASGFFAFAAIAVVALIVLRSVAPGWQRSVARRRRRGEGAASQPSAGGSAVDAALRERSELELA